MMELHYPKCNCIIRNEFGIRGHAVTAIIITPWYRVPLRCDYRCYITIKSGGEGKVVDSLDIM